MLDPVDPAALQPLACPACASGRVGTLERLTGVALVAGLAPSGELVHDGWTEIDWASSATETDAAGQPILACLDCGQAFALAEAARPPRPGGPA